MKFRLTLLLAVVLAGCGGDHHKTTTTKTPPAKLKALAACPSVPIGEGAPGACAPASFKAGAKPLATLVRGEVQIVDLSNNDPIYNFGPVAKHGIDAVWLKTNEGTGFIDRTFAPMSHAAKKSGLPTGGYDFVREYNAAEAHLFVSRLRATGNCRSSHTLPPTLDIEAGRAFRSGVQTMVNIVRAACGRVAIYTGLWYWNPYLGNWWPRGVSSWISGYPNIVGHADYPSVDVHQFTDKGYNGTLYGDLSRWKHTVKSFPAFINVKPRPHVVTKKERERLAHFIRELRAQRVLLRKNDCYRHRRKAVCVPLLRRGDEINAAIKLYHSRGIK